MGATKEISGPLPSHDPDVDEQPFFLLYPAFFVVFEFYMMLIQEEDRCSSRGVTWPGSQQAELLHLKEDDGE